jgi:hypothetical protein
MCLHPVVRDRRNKWLFWAIFEDQKRDEAKFVTCFNMYMGSFAEESYENSKVFSAEEDTNMGKLYHLGRDSH